MILEGLVLAYLSFLGVILLLGASVPFLSGSFSQEHIASFVSSILVAAFLITGWRVYFWAILGNLGSRGKISKLWLFISGVAVLFTVLGTLLHEFSTPNTSANIWYMQSQLFMLGLYFIPTAIHIFLHVFIEKIANKYRQGTLLT